jgi:hypothetical protein
MENCPICLENCKRNFLITPCCKKHFHKSCHSKCMKTNLSCPLCRHVVIQMEPEPESESVPIKFSCCCSKMLCYICIGFVIIFGIIGILVYCIATKKNFPVVKKYTNGTTY